MKTLLRLSLIITVLLAGVASAASGLPDTDFTNDASDRIQTDTQYSTHACCDEKQKSAFDCEKHCSAIFSSILSNQYNSSPLLTGKTPKPQTALLKPTNFQQTIYRPPIFS